MTGDLSACKSKQTLIQLLTVNMGPPPLIRAVHRAYVCQCAGPCHAPAAAVARRATRMCTNPMCCAAYKEGERRYRLLFPRPSRRARCPALSRAPPAKEMHIRASLYTLFRSGKTRSTPPLRHACRMDLPRPTTSMGSMSDYSVDPWDYSTWVTRHLMAWGARTTVEKYSDRKLCMSCTMQRTPRRT
jgi:hypothetical protein